MRKLLGVASACASATIVNAMATGKGAAFGIELRVKAEVKLKKNGRISGKILGSRESPRLIEICVEKTLEEFGEKGMGAEIKTTSSIPIAVGLSSSSAAANAAVLATIAALGEKIDYRKALKIAIDSAFAAGVTLTGALDDAAASMYGGGVITDNLRMKIIKQFKVDPALRVAVHVPRKKLYTKSLKSIDFSQIREGVERAYLLATRGKIWTALTLNGALYSALLKSDARPALFALLKGAMAAGITGKGPATVAVGDQQTISRVAEDWQKIEGRVILTRPASSGGRVEFQ